jgi:hypothetical protein
MWEHVSEKLENFQKRPMGPSVARKNVPRKREKRFLNFFFTKEEANRNFDLLSKQC